MLYGHRYKRFYHDPADRFTCFYCGDPADCMDHVPPLARVGDYESLGLRHPRYLKVAACPECNGIAGSELQDSILDRWAFVKSGLQARYKRILKQQEWDEEDLREAGLDGRLLAHVKGYSSQAARISARLDYSLGIQRYCDEFDSTDFPGESGEASRRRDVHFA